MTTLQLQELVRLAELGKNGVEIGAAIGMNPKSVYPWLKKLGIKPPGRHGPVCKAQYAVYNGRDELLACGTAPECAKAMGCRVQTTYRGAMKTRKGEGKFRFYYRIDGEGEDD